MAGTLTLSTLSDGTNSTSATNAIQGSAKAWVNFNGTTGAIRTSYNVSSVTRFSTGQFLVTFTNAMTDTNYCFQICARDANDGMGVPTAQADPTRSVTASELPIIYNYPLNQQYYDSDTITVAVFR